jgi:hypothetical protein
MTRGKILTIKPRIVSRLVSTLRISEDADLRCGFGVVVMRDQTAHRNPRERIEQRKLEGALAVTLYRECRDLE